jgi:hypothetical protein
MNAPPWPHNLPPHLLALVPPCFNFLCKLNGKALPVQWPANRAFDLQRAIPLCGGHPIRPMVCDNTA